MKMILRLPDLGHQENHPLKKKRKGKFKNKKWKRIFKK